MSAAVALMLEGMPSPWDLHLHRAAGRVVVLAGSAVVAEYAEGDLALRNMVIVTLRRVGFPGWRVAEVFGLTPTYVSRLKTAAARGGAAALASQDRPGRPRALGEDQQDLARQWREQGESDLEIGRRLGVAGTTVARRLSARPAGPVPGRGRRSLSSRGRPEPAAGARAGARSHRARADPGAGEAARGRGQRGPGGAARGGAGQLSPPGPGGPRITGGVFWSRYAGAMLLHAFTARAGAGQVLESAAGAGRGAGRYRFADVALLSVTSMCFALGAETIEQVKHLTAACAGPLAGLAVLPHLRTLRPALAAIADACDPLALQEMAARAMLAAGPVTSGVYYVDDHFVPYAGAKPVAKGWNNKRGKAERGRADTHVTAHDGRAVCFVTGEPSGLAVTLPKALAELKKAAPPGATIMLGFDRGGAYAQVFRHCRDQHVHWVSYRRAPLAVPAVLPVITTITVGGRRREIAWAEEKPSSSRTTAKPASSRLFEHGKVVLQILTSDFDSCPADILAWLKSRWREENFLKYASRKLRDRQDLRLHRRHRDQHQDRGQPGPQEGQCRRPRGRKGPRRRRTGPGRAARRPGHQPGRQEHPADPRRAEQDRRRAQETGRRRRRPATRSPPNCPPTSSTPKPRSRCCAPAAAACRWCCGYSRTTPSTGCRATSTPTCETMMNTAPSPARPSSAAWPGPSPTPRRPSPSSSRGPAPPASPAPWPCSSTRSTTPRPPCPATPGPSPTSSPRTSPDQTNNAERLPEI